MPVMQPLRRTLAVAALFALLACSDPGLRDTEPRVRAPPELDFGRVWLGDTATKTLAIESIGTGWWRLLALEAAPFASDLAAPEGGLRIAPGETKRVTLTWTPVQVGPVEASITVRTDVEDARELVVRVKGEARAEPDCDDRSACTDDRFDRATESCVHAFHDRTCDDGSACTEADRCHEGTCRGRAKTCDDDDVCTLDLCDPAKGCVFPPDDRRCDDGDPCTADVCDRDAGCAHPDAPNGTACGALSCSTAHLCIGGDCREVDVRGSSDTLPCSDGDRCTEGDACLAGECVGGTRVQSAPAVVATLETFGGSGSTVATDGHRYVFADPDALRIAVRGAAGIQHVATLPLKAVVPPVLLAPGLFVVAEASSLSLVDATDAARPQVTWTRVQTELGLPADFRATHLALATPGVLAFAGQSRLEQNLPLGHIGSLVLDGVQPPGPARMLSTDLARDLAADGPALAILGYSRSVWFPFDWTRSVELPRTVSAVSVRGARAALLYADRIELQEAVAGPAGRPVECDAGDWCAEVPAAAPSCSLVFGPGVYRGCRDAGDCDAGSDCIDTGVRCGCGVDCSDSEPPTPVRVCVWNGFPEVRSLALIPAVGATDVLLEDDVLYWSTADGLFGVPVAAMLPPYGQPLPDVIDFVGATRLERGPDHVLASGPIALPIERQPLTFTPPALPTMPPHRRVTGSGHGDVSVVTNDSATLVRVAGPVAVGAIELSEKKFSSWNLSRSAATPQAPRLLQGNPIKAVAGVTSDDGATATLPCAGVRPRFIDLSGNDGVYGICGLHTGRFDVAAGRLWAVTDEFAGTGARAPVPTLRAWSLLPFASEPFVNEPAAAHWTQSMVRASDTGTHVAVSTWSASPSVPSSVKLRVYAADARRPVQRSLHVAGDVTLHRDTIAVDEAAALVAWRDAVSLFALPEGDSTPQDIPRTTLRFGDAVGPDFARVPWMANGRAWVSMRRETITGQHRQSLVELHYDPASSLLAARGLVDLPNPALGVRDTGAFTVVTTSNGVSIVAPACR